MKHFLPLILGFFSILFTHAQVVTVIDTENNMPLRFVSISSETPRAFVTTDAKGQAPLKPFINADKIVFRNLGYKKLTYSFDSLRKQNFVVYMTGTSMQFEEVVVTATKWQQSSHSLPQKITSIKTKNIQLQNPQTAADLLGTTGEVYIQKSQQGGGSPMIRGFAANRLLYTVDGVRMNTAIFRAGNLQNVISLDVFAMERAEVLFGPGSIMYGSDAIGGVMGFQTLTPHFSNDTTPLVTGNSTLRYSSANNERTGNFQVQVGWKKWAFATSFTQSEFGDLRMGTRGPKEYLRNFYVMRQDSADVIVQNENPLIQRPTGYKQTNVMQKIRFQPNKNWDVTYGFHHSQTSSYSRYDRLIETNDNGLPGSALWNYGPQKWMMNQLTLNHLKENKLYDKAALRLAHQFFEESRINRNFSGGSRFRERTQLESVHAYSANLDLEKQRGQHYFSYGLEAVFNDVTSVASAFDIRNNNPIPVAARYPNATWGSYAAYIHHQFLVAPNASMHSGIRYTYFNLFSDFTNNSAFFPFDFQTTTLGNDALTGSYGWVITPGKGWKLHANLNTAFRAPNVDDIGKSFDFADGEVMVPNPNLRPETAFNGELGASHVMGEILKIDATVYYTYLNNAMVRRPFVVNGQDSILYNGDLRRSFALQNAAYGTVYGFHIGADANFAPGWNLTTKFNYQKGMEEMDNGTLSASRHATPAFGLTALTFTHKKLTLQLYSHYSAGVSFENLNEEERLKPALYAQDAEGRPYAPAWYTLNFKAMAEISSQIMLTAGLENITDQRYRPYSSGIAGAGTNLVVALRATI